MCGSREQSGWISACQQKLLAGAFVCGPSCPRAREPNPRAVVSGQAVKKSYGREYRAAQAFVAAHISTSPTFSVTSREVLFPDRYTRGAGHHSFDVSPDGKQFVLMAHGDSVPSVVVVVVVTNWLTELRARMAAARGKR